MLRVFLYDDVSMFIPGVVIRDYSNENPGQFVSRRRCDEGATNETKSEQDQGSGEELHRQGRKVRLFEFVRFSSSFILNNALFSQSPPHH